MAEWTRNASVAVFVLALGGAGVMLGKLFVKGRFGPKGIVLHTTLKEATGLATLSRINIAGIPIGSIKAINLTPDGHARIDVAINPGIVLHKDATVSKQTATLLSEPFLGMTPGSDNTPLMVDGDEIVNVIEPPSTEQILSTVGKIADNVNLVTQSMAASLGSKEGERQMAAILHNIEQATAQIALITQENRVSLRNTFRNFEEISADAKPKAAKILGQVDQATDRVNRIVGDNRDDLRATTRNMREASERADKATVPLEGALSHIESITARIDRGEGSIGRLTKDEALIDEVQGAAEGVNDLVGGLARLQTIVGLRSDYYFLSNTLKNYVEIRLQPREDKYYVIELVNDPRGKTTISQQDVDTTNPTLPAHYRTVTSTTETGLRFSLQFARRLGPFTGRFGIKESTGGVGVDTHLFENRFELQQDLFGFSEQLIPRWRVALFYEFIKRLWLLGGVDNLLVPDRRDYFVGLQLRFNDDDLKSVLFVAPKPP